MKKRIAREIVKIPKAIDVVINQSIVSVKGPLGKLERNFSHASVDISRIGDEIFIEAMWPDKKKMAMIGTIKSHIRNMMTGVVKGFTYKLKIVYAHFPLNVKVSGNELVVENFGGERQSRKVKIPSSINVTIAGDDVVLKGIDLEEVSQSAANIQQITRIKNKDPRIFLDGIYVYEKGEG